VLVKGYNEFEVLGQTRDDAAGEAFDKVARAVGLGYPGGPLIDKAAREGNPDAIDFPKVYIDAESNDFSFSGLKSAVLNYLNSKKQKQEEININDVAASFQKSAVEVLVNKAVRVAKEKDSKYIVLAGGVAANSCLREELEKSALENGLMVRFPSSVLCTDNAAMIGCAAYYRYKDNIISDQHLNAIPNLKIGER
jgi:N6-L-threonylcarbamoyladenine synthase